jgi:hypothetical protein
MPHKPRTRFQRMHLALELAGVIERNATNDSLKELASAVQLVLAAPGEMLSEHRLGRIEQLIHENSGNCCFRQRGYITGTLMMASGSSRAVKRARSSTPGQQRCMQPCTMRSSVYSGQRNSRRRKQYLEIGITR